MVITEHQNPPNQLCSSHLSVCTGNQWVTGAVRSGERQVWAVLHEPSVTSGVLCFP